MTSQAQALEPLPGVRGLVFIGFPLHPAGKPPKERADHLFEIQIPVLFLQGTRDELAELNLLQDICDRRGRRATLKLFQEADHSFHVPVRSGQKDAQVLTDLMDSLLSWLSRQTRF